jgi:hypothetical protein
MKKKIVFLFILLFLGSFCQADDSARDRATLRGIQSIIVKVNPLAAEWRAELEKVGLSESVLQSSIEQQLQKAGIQVLAEEDANQTAFEGYLNVRLQFADYEPAKKTFLSLDDKQEKIEKADTKKKYTYAIRLNLRQLVALKRDPSAYVFSITWQSESVGVRRLALIKDHLKTQVDVFIEAYASENPDLIKR